ncbi:hypothetical protein NQ318_013582 [Aromia moschata]|uniref:Cyclin-dependent kinase inhibitor domain-containing protein n=1 Tax=Aromia moschata TaxID=1265417 RepID=A0AAV8YEE1_9CUCU|nr:hypothetical protein NQ318_013582 [Aromia moschata]
MRGIYRELIYRAFRYYHIEGVQLLRDHSETADPLGQDNFMAHKNHVRPTSEGNSTDHVTEDGNPPRSEDQSRHRKTNARRRLDFDDDDVANETSDVTDFLSLSSEEIHRRRQKAIEKWNFDFENEVPLDGDWEWQRVPVPSVENKEVVSSMEKRCSENRTV